MEPWQRLFRAYWELETPVVSAVNGTTAGAGWMLALLADLVVAAEGARWIHAFARRGMVPHGGDPFFLSHVLPFHRLLEAALLSDALTSEELHEWGSVNRLVPAADVERTAGELATQLAAGPTKSLGLTKRLYRRALVSDMATAQPITSRPPTATLRRKLALTRNSARNPMPTAAPLTMRAGPSAAEDSSTASATGTPQASRARNRCTMNSA